VNFPLDPELDLTKLLMTSCKRITLSRISFGTTYLLFLPTKLFFLEAHTLGSEFLGQNGGVADRQQMSQVSRPEKKHVLGIIIDGAGQLLGTVSLVENVVRQRLEIGQVRASSQPL